MLQIPEGHFVEAEVYASTVPAAVFALLFFLGLPSPKADFYYKWFGKNMSFYVYILHMAVGIVVGRIWVFENLFLRSLVILGISMGLYELGYLLSSRYHHIKRKN